MISEADLTQDQQNAIRGTKEWFSSLSRGKDIRKTWRYVGYAGTGKTTSAIFTVEACGIDPDSKDLCAGVFTGKGAQRLREAGVGQARTIHSLIYLPKEAEHSKEEALKENIVRLRYQHERGEDCLDVLQRQEKLLRDLMGSRKSDTLSFVLNPDSPIQDCRLVFIDEASMVGGQVMRDLESFGKPIIYCGDSFQLPPIDRDGSALFDSNANPLAPDVEIKEIVRQLAGNPIIRAASRIREHGIVPCRGEKEGDEETGMIHTTSRGRIGNESLAGADQVIVGKNKSRVWYNGKIRSHLGYHTEYPSKGEKVICLRNNQEHHLFNGMMGHAAASSYSGTDEVYFHIALEMDGDRNAREIKALRTYFQHAGEVDKKISLLPRWALSEYIHLDYGNAITLHKAQGSEWENVLLFSEPIGRTREERLRWWYTGVTRARSKLVIAL